MILSDKCEDFRHLKDLKLIQGILISKTDCTYLLIQLYVELTKHIKNYQNFSSLPKLWSTVFIAKVKVMWQQGRQL